MAKILSRTSQKLQIREEGSGIIHLYTYENGINPGHLGLRFEASVLDPDAKLPRPFMLEDRDDIRELGEWFSVLTNDTEINYPAAGFTCSNSQDCRSAAAAILTSAERTPDELSELATDSGLAVPIDLTPIMIAHQTYRALSMNFHPYNLYTSLPVAQAQQFGVWVLESLDTVQPPKSVWRMG